MDRRDVRTLDRIPVTTPARTLLDLGAVVSASELERALAEAQVRRLVRRRDLLDQLERNRGRAGTRALREILEVPGGPAPTRSEAERRLLRLVRSAGLPRPLVNTGVASLEVDVCGATSGSSSRSTASGSTPHVPASNATGSATLCSRHRATPSCESPRGSW